MAEPVPQEAFGTYRHAIDIDGNASAWAGLFSKLILGNTVLKVNSAAGYRQWYYDRLIPFRNFIPVRADMSDLIEIAHWLGAHKAAAEEIAARGAALAQALTWQAVMDDAADRIRAALRDD